jgi:hypothetical protein
LDILIVARAAGTRALKSAFFRLLLMRQFPTMNSPQRKSLSIAPTHDKPTLSKMQKAFNTLIEKIEKKRALLSDWEKAIPAFQQKYAADLIPLKAKYDELRIRLAHHFDQICHEKGINKSERSFIAGLVVDMTEDLLTERDDPELKAIFNRYSGVDYDTEAAAELDDAKVMLEHVFGVELGDDVDMSSPDDMVERIARQMHENAEAEAQEREERQAKRKKTARQVAAESKKEAEQAELSQSVREVYRKLASALHPDRESDPAERDRKTALMQRVNQAYGRNNLLQLLELQLELEHIDQDALKNISQDRLKHYNAILKEQLAELDAEIMCVEVDFMERYELDPFEPVSPESVMIDLDDHLAELHSDTERIETEMLPMFDDIKKVKAWIKRARNEARMNSFD